MHISLAIGGCTRNTNEIKVLELNRIFATSFVLIKILMINKSMSVNFKYIHNFTKIYSTVSIAIVYLLLEDNYIFGNFQKKLKRLINVKNVRLINGIFEIKNDRFKRCY